MRHAPAALAVLFVLVPATLAQVGPDIRQVSVTRAEVRSGPSNSEQFYVTNVLAKGHPVEVVQELPDGWLKIRPPAGSFSWINTRFLEHISPNQPTYVMALDGAEAPVFIGSETMREKRPTVVGVRLKRGTQVVSVGKTHTDAEGSWMPIEPPASETRYIKSEFVARSSFTAASPVGGNGTDTLGSATGGTSGLPTSKAPSANPNPPASVLWQKAVAADRAGQYTDAIKLYSLLASETAKSHPVVSSQALRRAAYLQTLTTANQGGLDRLPPAPPATFGSPNTESRKGTLPRGAATQTYVGTLKRAGRAFDDKKLYTLERSTSQEYRLYYVVAGAGVDLERYLDKEVEVSGPTLYIGWLRNNCMTATRVTGR